MLRDRETIVLKYVVQEFVSTNRPVGSEKLSLRLGLSSASIRNTMNLLLQDGYLVQPHTSAGRTPSDAGYRYFVDFLLEEYRLAETEGQALQGCLDALQARLDRMLIDIAAMLSRSTDCLAFVTVPEIQQCEISRIDITRLSGARALLILVLSNGMVENRFIPLPLGAEELQLDRIASRLNERLHGRHVSSVNSEFLEAVFSEIRLSEERIRESIKEFFRTLILSFSRRVFVDGAEEIIAQPEFRDSSRLLPLLEAVSEDNPGSNVFSFPVGDRLPEVTIGSENAILSLSECSIIKSHFRFGDSTTGAIGLIGPKRMQYARLLTLVNHMADSLSGALSRFTLT